MAQLQVVLQWGDEAVICGLDEEERRHYGQTLLDLVAFPPSRLGQLTITLCEERTQWKERLVSIVNYYKKGVAAIIATLLLLLTMVGCALVNGTEPTQSQTNGPPQTQADGTPQVANLEDSRVFTSDDSAIAPVTGPEGDQAGNIDDGLTAGSVSITVSNGRRLTLVMQDAQNEGSGYGPRPYGQLQILDGNNIIQTVTQDDVTLDDNYLFDGFLANFLEPQIQDVSFDGAEDFGLVCGSSSNGPLCWFVWDQEDGQFHFAFYSSIELRVDQSKRQLVDVWMDGNTGADYYVYEYNDQKERIQVDHYFLTTDQG